MKKTIKDQCPMALEEITFIFDDPEEPVLTQRKVDGVYRKVLKPRKEVKGSMNIEIHCPAVDPTKPMTGLNPPNPWCAKRNDVCPIYEVSRTLLKKRGYRPNQKRIDIISE
jgi:hypothetical protein